ncbi:hypothetical protein GCM10025873_07060 [Demequina sediminis]|nr:hypothetical protein GCM10025873_07060 [Demequina sediminis]
MAEVVRGCGRLHHDRVASTQIPYERATLASVAHERDGDRARDGRHLHGMREAVVDRESGAGLRDHLSDRGQPREVRREADALEVDAELGAILDQLKLVELLGDATRDARVHRRRLTHATSPGRSPSFGYRGRYRRPTPGVQPRGRACRGMTQAPPPEGDGA